MINKDDLFKNGYSIFSLKEFDIDLYNRLYPISDYVETDSKNWSFTWQFNTKMNREDILKVIESNELTRVCHVDTIFAEYPNKVKYPNEEVFNCDLSIDIKDIKDREYIKDFLINNLDVKESGQFFFNKKVLELSLNIKISDIIKDIYEYFYEIPVNDVNIYNVENNCTFFSKDCFIINHQDGFNPERVCGILIYLTKDYKYETGGHLVLDGGVVVTPEIGKVVVLDYTKNNVEHMVTPVMNESGRSAILKFISRI